jgi:prepilin-type N-terminal cleavage/methylation domain-containing protein
VNGRHTSGSHGFTLLEILVSTAVFVVLMLTLVSIVGAISESWSFGRGIAESQLRSRAILDLIGRDLRHKVAQPTLPAFDGGRFRFYTLQGGSSGVSGTDRRLTHVDYSLGTTNATLYRDEAEFTNWSANPTNIPLGATNTPNLATTNNEVAAGVSGFAYAYLLTNGLYTNSLSATDRPVGVRVSLAVLDEQALTQLRAVGLESNLLQLLQPGPVGTNSPVTFWETALNAAEWKVDGINLPQSVRRRLRFFERTYTWDNP